MGENMNYQCNKDLYPEYILLQLNNKKPQNTIEKMDLNRCFFSPKKIYK